jgi:riboflavin kinase/FMN adenylyltransferase
MMEAQQMTSNAAASRSQNSNVEELAHARARRAMQEGRPDEARRILGKPWSIRAQVQHGDARGRTIGFPTANLHLDEKEPLAYGIYAVRASLLTVEGDVESRHNAVANFGIRPMFRTDKPLLEVHIFDFSADIYDRHLLVDLIAWLRPEAKFDGLEALVAQIAADAEAARVILGRAP